MIMGIGVLIIGILITLIGLKPLLKGLKDSDGFVWDYKPSLVGIIICLGSLQYIFG